MSDTAPAVTVRGFMPSDEDRVNALARAAFAQYEGQYDDWPSFIDGIGRMAQMTAGGDLFVAEHGGAIAGAVVTSGPAGRAAQSFPMRGRSYGCWWSRRSAVAWASEGSWLPPAWSVRSVTTHRRSACTRARSWRRRCGCTRQSGSRATATCRRSGACRMGGMCCRRMGSMRPSLYCVERSRTDR